jgi:phosphatidylglycerophosphate synthase
MARPATLLALAGLALVIIAAAITRAGLDGIFVIGAVVSYGVAATILAIWARAAAYRRFSAADVVTLARLVIACLFAGYAGALIQGFAPTSAFAYAAACLGLAALLLDGVDGWLARRYGTASAFGARFDMEVDAFLILVLAMIAWANAKAGAWVLLSGAARYLYVAAGRLCPALTRPLFSSHRRKVIAVIQGAVLVGLLVPEIVPPLSSLLASVALLLLLSSFAADIRWQLGTPPGRPLSLAGE